MDVAELNGHPIDIGQTIYLEKVFTASQWEEIELLIQTIASKKELLETITKGYGRLENTKFSLYLYKFISNLNGISIETDSEYTRQLLKIINQSDLINQINFVAKKNLKILRMQLNIMGEGSFVQRHVDYDSDHSFCCSLLIRTASQYTGGDFIIYDVEGCAHQIRQANRSILMMSSHSPHEVEIISSGTRYTICLFCG